MKAKNVLLFVASVFISLISMTFTSTDCFANFNDTENNMYNASINKMYELDILKGVGDNRYNPKGNVTREQFATIVVKILDLEDNANLNKYNSVFSDVEVGRWSVGYINEAYNNNLITGKTDGLFYPEENITFGQICTILVKTLGYTDQDVVGVWPNNYVNCANDLDITKDITVNPLEYVTREQIAYILDKLLDTNIKNTNTTIAQRYDIYIEDVVTANFITNESLKYNQISTIKNGILDKDDTVWNLDVGEKYDFVLKDGVITKAIKLANKVEKVTVVDYKEGRLNYYKGNEINSMTLSEKNDYYNNGVKVRFDSLENIIKRNTVLVFLYDNKNNIIVEAVTAIDPIHSEPIVVNDNIASNGVIEGFDLNKLPIIKEGKYITIDDIEDRDVIYKITSYCNEHRFYETQKQNEHSYYEIVNQTVQGEITDILPNKLAPSHVEIDNVSYPIGKYMDMSKLTDANNGYEVDDKVCAILGYDKKIVDLMDKDVKTGKYQKLRILGNSKSIDTFKDNQILTDKGTYYVLDDIEELELGAKYELLIDDDTIVKVGEKTKNQLEVSVINVDGQKITYGKERETMLLPTTAKYYYNGVLKSYAEILGVLEYNTTIIFVYNENETGYEYGIVIDPIYSEPKVVNNNIDKNGVLDGYNLKELALLKEGKYITVDDIENKDVIYRITNYYGKNCYYEVISNTVQGEMTDILPNKLAPSYIEIENKEYPISEYMNMTKLTDAENGYEVGDKVCAILGYDKKIVDLMDKDVKTGKYQKLRILGNGRSIDTFEDNQILTDKGTYYVLDGIEELELGAKYELLIDDDTIVKVGEKTKNQLEVSVRNVDGQKITYGKEGKTMLLPTTTKYYYNGVLKTYKEILGVLDYNTSIIFVYNENETGFEYGIVIDALYSEPKLIKGYNPYQNHEYDGLKYSRDIPVIIDGKTTDIYSINNNTVMYMISDYWGNNKYLLILDTKVIGKISEFLPTRLNVNAIKLEFNDGTFATYGLSEYFDINTITENRKINAYKEGVHVNAYLDKNGKIFYLE